MEFIKNIGHDVMQEEYEIGQDFPVLIFLKFFTKNVLTNIGKCVTI